MATRKAAWAQRLVWVGRERGNGFVAHRQAEPALVAKSARSWTGPDCNSRNVFSALTWRSASVSGRCRREAIESAVPFNLKKRAVCKAFA
jgi:hypothetical protein